jgi:serine/threonine protein kinase
MNVEPGGLQCTHASTHWYGLISHSGQHVVHQWALQLVQALTFLHGCKPPIIHRDLKPENTFKTPSSTGIWSQKIPSKHHHPPGSEARKYLQNTIIHRDLKPENTMLSRQGLHTLADLGLSKTYEKTPGEEYAMTGETGTVLYMAPEVMRSDDYDGKVAVLSCAVML